jgi:predicted P-loop ATPase
MRAAALGLISQGVVPIPVVYRRKNPIDSEWQRTRLETVNIDAFDGKVNLGALLGEPSAWLVDVDLDCSETVSLAPYMLQSTRIFGRDSARGSHYLYHSIGAETAKFYDPVMVARKEKRKAMLVELRSTGCQSVFPPSVHELGEPIEYDTDSEDAPAAVKASKLLEEIEELAAAALFVRYAGLEVEQAVAAARERRLPDDLPDLVIEAARKWLHMVPVTAGRAPTGPGGADVLTRARAYLARIPGAVSGNGGHDTTYDAALAMACGFDLDDGTALMLLREYNTRCDPQWTDRELEHKVADARRSAKVGRGYLLNAQRPAATNPRSAPPITDGADAPVTNIDTARRPWRSRSYLTAVGIISENARDVLDGRALELNEMTGRIELGRKQLTDADESVIRANIEARFVGGVDKNDREVGLQLSITDVTAAVAQVANTNPYHPVREYLSGLKWDGVERLDFVVGDILHGEDTPLNRMLIRKFFISAAARPLNPGCKVDTVLILVGEQGARKSTFFRTISSPWFDDTAIDLAKKDAFESLRNTWLLEWAELESLLRARDTNSVKAFLSSPKDTYRPSYGRNVIEVKRSGIIVGSTNHHEFLSDETGARRFWPVVVGVIDSALAAEQRDQLWAEAVHRYRAGEPWWLESDAELALAGVHREHLVRDAWEERILTWASILDGFTTADVLSKAIQKEPGHWTRADEMRVSSVLRANGYTRKTDPLQRGRKTWRNSR